MSVGPTIEEVWRMARRDHFPHRTMDEHMAVFDAAMAREVAHAVALERNAIVEFIKADAAQVRASGSYEEEFELLTDVAEAIQRGDHNPQPPSSGPGAAQDGDGSASGPARTGGDVSGAQAIGNHEQEDGQ